ncbi:hypothetical protein HOP50_12g67790 [Chloropicon primus]|uniref:Uncharacterized protein n=2 Tax=Chloropicon primus TaxID=1764295 RepID=A0A5B8MUK8_9CHLO|nr:hypothetical protein A3770_12p67610 [Chloropicon primus]UPR03450.1 hypothetical protein HOP50_12g67790 [Chloropicon primus]|eukprot:QDZ24243.1 hypothetical protein A3770_12p67610 [Chloropicon primus]
MRAGIPTATPSSSRRQRGIRFRFREHQGNRNGKGSLAAAALLRRLSSPSPTRRVRFGFACQASAQRRRRRDGVDIDIDGDDIDGAGDGFGRRRRRREGGLFDFDSEESVVRDEQRRDRSKSEKKRQAKEYFRAAELLTSLGKKQLENLGPFLDDSVLDLVKLAQKLSVRNQGRKRLEQTIAKHLRTSEVGVEDIRRHLNL